MATMDGSSATVTITAPSVLSTPPIDGKFRIQCEDQHGTLHTTSDMPFNANPKTINNAIGQSMPHLIFRAYAWDMDEYAYPHNGVSFSIVFDGIDYMQLPLCSLLDGENTPITGNNPLFDVSNYRDFGVNRYWDVIPFEFLFADLDTPQIQVFVDGIEAVCPTFDCGYEYRWDEDEYKINSQALDGQTLTLVGPNLPQWGDSCNASSRRLLSDTAASVSEMTETSKSKVPSYFDDDDDEEDDYDDDEDDFDDEDDYEEYLQQTSRRRRRLEEVDDDDTTYDPVSAARDNANDYDCGDPAEYEVEFGGVQCDPSTIIADGTQIVCELVDAPAAGCHLATVISPWG